MKLLALWGLIGLGITGCYSAAKQNAELNSFYLDRYVQLMNNGQTTKQEDQDEIRICRIAWWAQNYYLSGAEIPADIRSDVNTYLSTRNQ